MTLPPRGFPEEAYRARVARAQALMAAGDLAALLLTTAPELTYYTGFLTRFWESPTRPWFLVIPAEGDPIAVIPSIGAHLMAQTWIREIRTWPAPDYEDDGVTLLADTLRCCAPDGACIGLAAHIESHARLPLASLTRLRECLGSRALVADAEITRRLRSVKSDGEIAKIQVSAHIADRVFDRMGEVAHAGVRLDEVFRRVQMLALDEGADAVPYIAGAAGRDGYPDVISPASPEPLAPGDVMMVDLGLVWDGYFCDFDRNYSIGPARPTVHAGHARLIAATQAGAAAAQPGARHCDLYHAMAQALGPERPAGRLGHGLGLQLTEGASILPTDHTTLEPGMVLTLEPVCAMPDGRLMVHEENIVIDQTGARFLSRPQAPEIRQL